MIEEILPNFYRIEVPLPGNPLKALNSYLIKGRERNLLIDTGFNREECRKVLLAGLKTLDAAAESTDLFITHLHVDHSGLISAIVTEQSAAYCGELDADLINQARTTSYWSDLMNLVGSYGFPLPELRLAIQKHPGYKYHPDKETVFNIVRENDMIRIDDYIFMCVETPGHTPGHVCLYEPNKKILVSGDHVLNNITPNITIEKGIIDLLGHYLKSLDKIDQMEISLVLPGHRRFDNNIHTRIAELKHHHENRLNEVLNILNDGQRNAYEVASKMTWEVSYTSWEQFPLAQKWFATGEAITHLEYLWYRNKIRRIDREGKLSFALKL